MAIEPARPRLVTSLWVMGTCWLLALGGCSEDEVGSPGPRAGSAGESSAGEGGESGAGGSGAGQGPAPLAGQAGEAAGGGEGGASAGGSSGGGGGELPSGGAAPGAAGETSSAGSGGAGAPPEPDLVITTGGPWPDSFTGACAKPTGVARCPAADDLFFGQDGSYRINRPGYSGNANVLTDSVTGLSWQLKPTLAPVSQSAAVAYCESLSLNGHEDWRLPTRLEYVTLVDYGLPGGFALPPAVPNDTTGTKWTSSPTGTTVDGFFIHNDELGSFDVALASTPAGARCVRGAPLSGALTVGADTTIDAMTGLEWQRSSLDDTPRTWQEALALCEQLQHAGHTDWRLPSLKELLTLVNEAAPAAPVVDAASFGGSVAEQYWSATPARSFSTEHVAFTLDLDFGATQTAKMTDTASARCVRTAD